MFICPVCNRTFDTETKAGKHLLSCWREHNPTHQSKSAPHSADKETRQMDDAAVNFFASFEKGNICKK